jgi:hypothetical protein
MLQGPNVTVDQMFSGCSMQVEMSLGCSVGGRSIKAPVKRFGWLTNSQVRERPRGQVWLMGRFKGRKFEVPWG